MVAIFTGAGAGFTRGSGNLLGGVGQLGGALLGRGGESVSVNAATGNLIISHQDEFLIGRGPDVSIDRTYNSQADAGDGDNGDNWQQSTTRRVFGLTGTASTAGSTISRQSSDGAVTVYTYDASRGYYVSPNTGGPVDVIAQWFGGAWAWQDGESLAMESYAAHGSDNWLIDVASDQHGNLLSFTYVSGTDKLDKVTTADGSWTQYTWSGNAITSVVTGYTDLATSTAKTLTRVLYSYDGSGRLETVTTDLTPGDSSVSDGAKYVTTYTYDGASNRVASIAQSDGSLLTIAYDGSNRVQTLTQTVATGVTRVTTLTYGTGYTTVTGPDSQVTRLDYDGSNRLTKITAPAAYSGATAQTVQFAYDADGNLDTVTDGNGKITSYDYDANGNATLITDATGNTVTRTYDAQNRLITELTTGADRDGASTPHYQQYVYDGEGHLRFAVNAAGQTTEYQYDNYGQLIRTIQYAEQRMTPPGSTPISEATAMDWAAAIADRSSVRVIDNSYDARGNLTQSKAYGIADTSGNPLTTEGTTTSNFIYDQAGNLIERYRPGENHETFLYDGMGRLYSSTDKNGGTTTIVFTDASTTTTVTTSLGLTTTSVYDKSGGLVSYTESGAATTAGTATSYYDAAGRLRKVVDASGREAYFYYDKAGRKVAEVNQLGELTEYRYDAAGRVAATIAYSTSLTGTPLTNMQNVAYSGDLSTMLPTASGNDVWSWTIYDDAGRAIQVIDNLGSTVTNEYDTEGKLAKTYAYFTKLSAGTLSTFKTTPPTTLQLPATNAKDTFSRVFYNKAGQQIASLDGEGYLTESIRDGAGLVTQTTSYAMATVSGDRAAGSLAVLKAGITLNAAADQVAYSVYDGEGLLRFSVNAEGGITGFTYDDAGRLIKTTVYATRQTLSDFTYDAVKAAAATNAADRVSWVVYDAAGRAAYTVDAEGGVTAFTYNIAGQVVKAIAYDNLYASTVDLTSLNSWSANTTQANDTANRLTRTWYNARGEAVYSIDAESFVTGYAYDAEGRVLSTTRYASTTSIAASKVVVSDTTTIGQLQTLISGFTNNITTSQSYDNAGRVLTVTDGEGVVTRNSYNALGQLTDVTEAYGLSDAATTHYTYDGAGRVLTVTGAYGASEAATVTYAYDGLGNRITVTDARGNATNYTFDKLGQVLTATNALSGVTTWVYDAFGNVVKVTDPRTKDTYNYYDNLGRLTLTVNAEKYVTTTAYNRFSEVSSSSTYKTAYAGTPVVGTLPSTGGLGTAVVLSTNTYDRLGRVATKIDAEGYGETYAYDAFGDLVTFRRYPGAITGSTYDQTSFEYDHRGSLTKTTDAESWVEQYSYDAFGRRATLTAKNETSAKTASGVTTYSYDKNGLLKSETLPIYSYNSAGVQSTKLIKTSYVYDKRGNLTQKIEADGLAEQRTTTYSYDKLDRKTSTKGDAVSGATVDATTKVVNFFAGSNKQIPTETITYDANGNITKIVDAAGSSTVFFYDQLNRKTVEINALGTYTLYTYDAGGNVTNIKIYETTVTVPANGGASSSQPAAPSGNKRETSFTYDGLGQMLTSSVVLPSGYKTGIWNGTAWTNATTASLDTAYSYDYLGNVVKVTDPNGNATYSYYDKLGRKTAQLDTEGYLTDWSYNSEGNVLQERRYNTKFTGTPTTTSPPSVSTNAADRVTAYTYDKVGNRLTEARSGVLIANGTFTSTSAQTSTITYTYNGLGQVLTKQEAAGDTFTYIYDNGGRLKQEKRPQYTSNNGSNVIPEVDYFYNGLGSVTRTVQVGGGEAAATSRVTTYGYPDDEGGRLWTKVDADGNVHTYRYDVAGRLTFEFYTRTITATDGTTTTVTEGIGYRYDALGRSLGQGFYKKNGSTWLFQSNSEYTTIAYNAFGDVIGTATNRSATDIASKGYQQEFKYDLAGRLWATNQGDGIWKYFGYDKNGNQTLLIEGAGETMSGLTLATAFAKISQANVNGTYTVYDKRNQATSAVQEGRELSTSVTQNLTTSRTYNAFGEVATETDALNYTTTYSYNTLGKVIRKESPTVSMTLANGTSRYIKPSEDYYYDASGRLIATRAANDLDINEPTNYATGGSSTNGTSKAANKGYLTKQTLLAGTGYGGTQALVVQVTHADGGTVTNKYNIFGDLREIGRSTGTTAGTLTTSQTYDSLGQVLTYTDAGGATWTYTYDELGNQVKNYNSVDGSSDAEITVFDIQGRVVGQRALGGDITTSTYTWNDTSTTDTIGVFGGWVKAVAGEGYNATYETDLFGRDADASKTYDAAGRLITDGGSNSGSTSDDYTFAYYNTGLLKSKIAAAGQTYLVYGAGTETTTPAKQHYFSYDAMGRLKTERSADYHVYSTGTINTHNGGNFQDAEVEYDALGRMTRYRDGMSLATKLVDKTWSYDAEGNIRSSSATYLAMNADGTYATTTSTVAQWYLYDSMNRTTLSQGTLSGSSIIAGSTGIALTYDQADRRLTSQTGAGSQEAYTLNAMGLVTEVKIGGVSRSTSSYDLLGRINGYIEKTATGSVVYERFAFVYNSRGQVLAEKSRQYQGTNWYYTHTVNYYNDTGFVTGTTTIPGTLTSSAGVGTSTGQQLYYSETKNWYNGTVVSPTGVPGYGATSDDNLADNHLQNWVAFDEELGWRQTSQLLETRDGTNTSTFTYGADGALSKVTRTINPYVFFYTDASGAIIDRFEEYATTQPALPKTHTYRFGGKEMGLVTNNGTTNTDYATLIDRRDNAPGTGKFLGGATSGTAYSSFDANHITLAGGAQDDTPGSWTVKAGDTLQGIAMAIWGDAGQWYRIAQANGVSDAGIAEGQVLVIPGAIGNIHNNADSLKPYDPNEAIGDVSPAVAKPPKKKGCGIIGMILLAAIAIGVAAIVGPEIIGAMQGVFGTVGGAMAAGAVAGAAGSIASQTVGLATGLQDKFSFKGVALAALGGAIGGGIQGLGELADAGSKLGSLTGAAKFLNGSSFGSGLVRGALSSALTQGIAVATGLQGSFNWAGVAAAGIGGGVGSWAGNHIGDLGMGNFGSDLVTGTAGAIANAATRSAIEGTSFGDNLKAAIPDAIGQVIGNALGRTVNGGGSSGGGSGNAHTPQGSGDAEAGNQRRGGYGTSSTGSELQAAGSLEQGTAAPVADSTGNVGTTVATNVAAPDQGASIIVTGDRGGSGQNENGIYYSDISTDVMPMNAFDVESQKKAFDEYEAQSGRTLDHDDFVNRIKYWEDYYGGPVGEIVVKPPWQVRSYLNAVQRHDLWLQDPDNSRISQKWHAEEAQKARWIAAEQRKFDYSIALVATGPAVIAAGIAAAPATALGVAGVGAAEGGYLGSLYRGSTGGEITPTTVATDSILGAAGGLAGRYVFAPLVSGAISKYGPTVSKIFSPAAETIPTFRNLAPLDKIAPQELFAASQIQRVGYTGKLEYVVLESGELVIGRSGHISLAQGADVLAAGEAKFFQGAVKRIDNMSGHYRPTGDSARIAAEAAFNRSGFDATGRYVERVFK